MTGVDNVFQNRFDDVAVDIQRRDFRGIAVDDVHVSQVAVIVILFQIVVDVCVEFLVNLTGSFPVEKMTVVEWLRTCTVERTYDIIIIIRACSFTTDVQLIVTDADFDASDDFDPVPVFFLLFFEFFMIEIEIELKRILISG